MLLHFFQAIIEILCNIFCTYHIVLRPCSYPDLLVYVLMILYLSIHV